MASIAIVSSNHTYDIKVMSGAYEPPKAVPSVAQKLLIMYVY